MHSVPVENGDHCFVVCFNRKSATEEVVLEMLGCPFDRDEFELIYCVFAFHCVQEPRGESYRSASIVVFLPQGSAEAFGQGVCR